MSDRLPDTVLYPDTFIRKAPLGFDGVFDWEWVKAAFSDTKISPTDLDAIIERRGNILVIETKDVGKEVPPGQLMTLDALHARGGVTVFYVFGKTVPEIIDIKAPVGIFDGRMRRHFIPPTDPNYLVQRWRDMAEKHPYPSENERQRKEREIREWVADYEANEHKFPPFRGATQ